MTIEWKMLFTKAVPAWADEWTFTEAPNVQTLRDLKHFLDLVHIKYCLVKPYRELADYPLVEARELLPSFEVDPWEHKKLPGFSLVAFARPLRFFYEVFQFDMLHPVDEYVRPDVAQQMITENLTTVQSRLARGLHEHFRYQFARADITNLMHYPALIPFLTGMDRAQVFGMHGQPGDMHFHLAGVYASFPSDLDTAVKRYGLKIGKFKLDDHDFYEKNRNFVLQHLMELYGFPVASERRTSAALFARRLHKMGERFLIRTLGQSDRVLTSIYSNGENIPYPHVEKIGLTRVEDNQDGVLERLRDEGYMINSEERVVILKALYRQHKFSPDNVRQERALSVAEHGVIHPLTGEYLPLPGILRETTNMFLRVNDIVRGEHTGRIVYKRSELIENTDTEEKRLKFLYAWLSKHQRRIIGYSDDFFANIDKLLDNYLFSPDSAERFADTADVYAEVKSRYSYILQARKIRLLEELHDRTNKGASIGYAEMLAGAVELLHSLKFEIVNYFDSLAATAISIGESMLNNRYIIRTYVDKNDDDLTQKGLDIKRNYGKLVSVIDELKSIRRLRTEGVKQKTSD